MTSVTQEFIPPMPARGGSVAIVDVNGDRVSPMPQTGGSVGHNTGAIAAPLTKTVAVPGTPERFVASSTPAVWADIQAKPGNTNQVAIGGSNAVRATTGSEVGRVLNAGESVFWPVVDLNLLWVDAKTAGEGILINYGTAA